jgi:hypothetical protein
MKISVLLLAATAMLCTSTEAFASWPHFSYAQRVLAMVGGRGWDNNDYLNGLGGDDDDRQKATEEYQEFSRNRQAFLNRQKEVMKTPQGRAFLEARGGTPQQNDRFDSNLPKDPIMDVKPGSGGGSRMAHMMAQAEQMKKMGQMNSMMGGFEQKFAVPLDDDEDGEGADVQRI